jgi:4-amino-4-deoxy-L-arabinose transferase-like glycosyltransferase
LESLLRIAQKGDTGDKGAGNPSAQKIRCKEQFVLRLLSAVFLFVVSVCIAAWQLHFNHDVWTPDGAIYLSMTMEHRGMDPASARAATSQFMLGELTKASTVVPTTPADRELYSRTPPQYFARQFELFRNRPLYPIVAASLFPRFGPFSLKVVSAAAYVASSLTIFAILLSMTSTVKALVGALVFATEPVVLGLAALPLTDELALFFWTCAFGATLAYQRRPSWYAAAVIFLASIALSFTRPAFFVPLGAAIGAYFVMRRSIKPLVAFAPLVATVVSAIVFLCFNAAVHGAGVGTALHWQYAWQRSIGGFASQDSPAVWYIKSLAVSAYRVLLLAVPNLGGVIVALFALAGLRYARTSSTAVISIASAAAILLAVFANPLDIERPVLLPLAPIVIVLGIVGFNRLYERQSQREL